MQIIKDHTRKTGYNIFISIELAMNYKDENLIKSLKNSFNVGNIHYNSNDKTYKWKVSNLDEINNKVIPHFNKYNLLTQKGADFYIFKKVVKILIAKEHLTEEGMKKIQEIKASMNTGRKE